MKKVFFVAMSFFVSAVALAATQFLDMTVIDDDLGYVTSAKASRTHGTKDLVSAVLTFQQPRPGDLWCYGMVFEDGFLISTTPVKRIIKQASSYNLADRFNHTGSGVTYEVLLWEYEPDDPPLAADLMDPAWHGYANLAHP